MEWSRWGRRQGETRHSWRTHLLRFISFKSSHIFPTSIVLTRQNTPCLVVVVMLCDTCESIALDLTSAEISAEIRRHANLDALQLLSSDCDFCSLVYEHVKQLDDPSIGRYCKQSWGMDFYRHLRSQSPLTVEHRSWQSEHNIVVACLLDAEHADGYPGGPRAFHWRVKLGGVYVEPGRD